MGRCVSQHALGRHSHPWQTPRADTHPPGQIHPLGRYTPRADTHSPEQTHPPQQALPLADSPPPDRHPSTSTTADGMHPTGMHSCCEIVLIWFDVFDYLDLYPFRLISFETCRSYKIVKKKLIKLSDTYELLINSMNLMIKNLIAVKRVWSHDSFSWSSMC